MPRLQLDRRLAALEARQTPLAAGGPLTAEDCGELLTQVALANVTLGDDGRARRAWPCADAEVTARLDRALARLNAALAAEVDPVATTGDLAWALAAYAPEEHVPPWAWGALAEKFPPPAEGGAHATP